MIFALDLVLREMVQRGFKEATDTGGFFSLGLPVVSAKRYFQSGCVFMLE